MERRKLNSALPDSLGVFDLSAHTEFMQYLYLPIKLTGSTTIQLEPRIRFVEPLIEAALNDFIEFDNVHDLEDVYVYLTLKQTIVVKDTHHNRPGWHSDGFGTQDINYIWCDSVPTEILRCGDVLITDDDQLSMLDFKSIASSNTHAIDRIRVNTLYRLTENHIHRTAASDKTAFRAFFKLTISKEKYAQEGNSHNYLLKYKWDMEKRAESRNQPQGNGTN